VTTAHQIQAAIQGAVSGVLQGLMFNSRPLAVDVGIGWPPLKRLQDVARGLPLVAVYDLRNQKNTTRWSPYSYNVVTVEPTLTTEVSTRMIAAGGFQTITVGGAVTVNDAVSCVIMNNAIQPFASGPPPTFQPYPIGAQVVIGGASDTPATMAAKLAAAINGDSVLSTWVVAAASGVEVMVTSRLTIGSLNLSSYTGNQATQTTELGRRERELQIVAWCTTEEMRQAVTDPIDVLIAQLEVNFGLNVADGYARIEYVGDYYVEDATLQDAYRRDFRINAEYAITTTDNLYSVLAPEIEMYTLAPPDL
jgi:hypothetical protein